MNETRDFRKRKTRSKTLERDERVSQEGARHSKETRGIEN